MSRLQDTINNSLRAVGRVTEERLRRILAEFDGMGLSDEERLDAVATAILSASRSHHRRHSVVYIEAVRTWALEMAAAAEPGPPRLDAPLDLERAEEGAELLATGIDGLLELMATLEIALQDRLVTELALVARLLGEHDANTINRALHEVERMLREPVAEETGLVEVPLRAPRVTRDTRLDVAVPQGMA